MQSVEEMGYSKKHGFTETYHIRLMTLIQTRLDNPDDYAGESGAVRTKKEEAEWEFVKNGGEGEEIEDEYNPPPRWEPWAAPGANVASGAGIPQGGGDYANVPPPGAGAPAPGEAPPAYI